MFFFKILRLTRAMVSHARMLLESGAQMFGTLHRNVFLTCPHILAVLPGPEARAPTSKPVVVHLFINIRLSSSKSNSIFAKCQVGLHGSVEYLCDRYTLHHLNCTDVHTLLCLYICKLTQRPCTTMILSPKLRTITLMCKSTVQSLPSTVNINHDI